MKRKKYVTPEIEIYGVSLEPLMVISGSGVDIPFGAPARPADESDVGRSVNGYKFKDLWDNNETEYEEYK